MDKHFQASQNNPKNLKFRILSFLYFSWCFRFWHGIVSVSILWYLSRYQIKNVAIVTTLLLTAHTPVNLLFQTLVQLVTYSPLAYLWRKQKKKRREACFEESLCKEMPLTTFITKKVSFKDLTGMPVRYRPLIVVWMDPSARPHNRYTQLSAEYGKSVWSI